MNINTANEVVKQLYDIAMNLYTYPAIIIAHHLGVFELIAIEPINVENLSKKLKLDKRPVVAIMAILHASHLVSLKKECYYLTEAYRDFLLKESPNYFGFFWDMMYDNSENYSLKKIEAAIISNKSTVYEEHELFSEHIHDVERLHKFTRSMHSVSIGSALYWPTKISLANHQKALDIGGGSGAHSIGMVSSWPDLECIVFDLPEICSISEEYISKAQLSNKIVTIGGNMWQDDYPDADLHFYSNIFHDWPLEKNIYLAKKSYDSLPKGGMIVIHEILFNDDMPGPLAAAGSSLVMLGWTEGQQYSGKELKHLLSQAGFVNIEISPVFGYHSIIKAIKN